MDGGHNNNQEVKLYAPRERIYPKAVSGQIRRIKWIVLGVIMGVYYLLPWLRWDRGPNAADQAVLLDMTAPRFYFFEIEIWPQEIYYVTGLLIFGAMLLFLVTALAGRIWCGFSCPQTIWTDLFMQVERWIEGDRAKRMRRDQGPLSLDKIWRKAAKHSAWAFIAFLTGGAWILYFGDAPTLIVEFFAGRAAEEFYIFTGVFSLFTYVFAGWAREQVCIYMCPWPRFQSAMLDEHSLVVSYEEWRGEPRGKLDVKGVGDCVDCSLCQQVCPTGVDIRKGQQLACIGCGLCIDACNGVMDKVGKPRNLISWDSITNQAARAKGLPAKFKFIRTRTVIYALTVLIIVGQIAWGLIYRNTVEINVQRDRAPMFVTLSDGSIRNGYTFKVLNMDQTDRVFELTTSGVKDALISIIGQEAADVPAAILPVKGDSVGTFRLFLKAPLAAVQEKSMRLEFRLMDTTSGRVTEYETVFAGPPK